MRLHPPDRRQRRGMTSVLAMLYLILFSSLAVGFYAATNTAVQIAKNETHARQAMLSAESGLEFMRHVLGNVEIAHFTPKDQMWQQLCQQVAAQVTNTANFGNATVTPPLAGQTTWTLPQLKLPGGAVCTVTLAPADSNAKQIDVTVLGVEPDLRTNAGVGTPPLHRKLQLSFLQGPRASAIFDYGVASRSSISMGGKSVITGATGELSRGSVLSATANSVPLTMSGNPSISGDFSYTNPAATPSYGSGTIAGYPSSSSEFANHVHPGVPAPEFPTIDTSDFEKYVPPATAPPGPDVISTSNASLPSYANIRIKAGANPNFSGGVTLRGVVYIETPNKITFTGGAKIIGVVVVQNNPTGDSSTNTIKFGGNVTHVGVDVPLDKGGLDPADPRFSGLSNLSGSFLLAPKFEVIMTGTANSVGGTIVAGQTTIKGTAGANIKGTLINLDDTMVDMTGNAGVTISASGTENYPAGVTFGTHYVPSARSYMELQ